MLEFFYAGAEPCMSDVRHQEIVTMKYIATNVVFRNSEVCSTSLICIGLALYFK